MNSQSGYYHLTDLPSEFLLGPHGISSGSSIIHGQLMSIQEQLANSSTNSSSSSSAAFGDYNTVVISLNSPFVLIFGGLFIASVVSYLMQQKTMKRNQHILFAILFVLESLVFVNMLTRIASELALLHMVPNEGRVASVVIKIFDRCFVNIAIFVEVVLMSHICYIFAETCRSICVISERVFEIVRKCLFGFLIILGSLFILLCCTTIAFGGLAAGRAQIDANLLSYLQLALFLSAAVLFFISTVSVSIFLNIIGRKLVKSLKESKERIKNMIRGATPSDIKGKSIEKIKTYKFKKVALRKSMAIQYGLTISLIFQFIGFIFIPLSLTWNYFMNFFHMLYNIGIIAFVVLILSIYNPLREVQKLFRIDSDSKIVPSASPSQYRQSKSSAEEFISPNSSDCIELEGMKKFKSPTSPTGLELSVDQSLSSLDSSILSSIASDK